MIRAHRGLSFVATLVLSALPAFGQPGIQFRGLGNPEGYVSRAYDVSSDGTVVVGTNELAPDTSALIVEMAFSWTDSAGQTALGFLDGSPPASAAYGVSPDGTHAAGRSFSAQGQQAALWSGNSPPTSLGFLTSLSESEAAAVSQAGQFVAGTNASSPGGIPLPPFLRAFRWSDSIGLEDLGGLMESGESSATDISRSGNVVVGRASPPIPPDNLFIRDESHEAFVWTPDDGMMGLGHFPYKPTDVPNAYLSSEATAVSAGGDFVVGSSAMVSFDGLPDLFHRAFRWTEASGLEDLGDLPVDVCCLEYDPVDVSANGAFVVGNATLVTTQPEFTEAFIWTPDSGMDFLTNYLRNEFGFEVPMGWDLGLVSAISDDGTTLVGTGTNPDGTQEAWSLRLRTVPEPSTWAFLLGGSLAVFAFRR